MSEKAKQHSLSWDNNLLTVKGIAQVMGITEKEATFKLSENTLTVKGSGLNVLKLDREQGIVVLETANLTSLVYRQNGVNLKGLFR